MKPVLRPIHIHGASASKPLMGARGIVFKIPQFQLVSSRLWVTEPKIVERTDLGIVSNNSACGGDVAAYLTGARLRFGTHHIDNSLKESEFYLQQISTGEIVHVKLNPDLYLTEVKVQMKKIDSGDFTPKDLGKFQELQWGYAKRMVNSPLKESFILEEMKD